MQWIATWNGGRPCRLAGALALAALLLAPLLAIPAAAGAATSAATVTYLEIPAQIKHKGASDWKVLNRGDEVREGDTIRTGMGGRVEVTISPKRVFRVGQATEVELPAFDTKVGLHASFNVLVGRFWTSVRAPLAEALGESVQVSTTTATIGIKGTQFGVDHDRVHEASQVTVVEGTVTAASPKEGGGKQEVAGPREVAPPQEISRDQWLLLVSRNQKLLIRPGEAPKVEPMTAADKADEWVVFNHERDLAQDAAK
jgi:hypothetical protein